MTDPVSRFLAVDDYTSGVLPESEAAAFEEELFASSARGDAPEAAEADDFFRRVQWFTGHGGFGVALTSKEAARLRGMPGVHYIDVIANTVVRPWPAGTELIAYRVDVDLRGCDAVEVELRDGDGEHRKFFRDVSYDPDDGAIYAKCYEPVAYAAFLAGPTIVRVAGKKGGREAVVSELRITQG